FGTVEAGWTNLSHQWFYHLAMHVGKTIVAALESVGQPGVIQTEQVQNRSMQIVHVHFVFDGVKTEFVRFPVSDAWLDSTASQPNRITMRMVVAVNLVR